MMLRHFTWFTLKLKLSDEYLMEHINPLNAKLNPICQMLALIEAHFILHVSRIWVKFITL